MIDDMRSRFRGHASRRPGAHPAAHAAHRPDFQPPEVVAAAEETQPGTSTAAPLISSKGPIWKRMGKKQWLIVAAVIVAGAAGLTAFLLLHHPKPTATATYTVHQTTITKQAPPVPTTVASKLTGLQVDPAVNQRPVTGVMIENSPDARPQSGLDQAGVVFEAVAEGGITRFLALYQDTEPAYIGPVRSVRYYYLEWLSGFDAPVAHVGGSAEAIQDIKDWSIKDLDQFYNGGYYHRISSRVAPHNVYTSMAELRQIETNKGITSSNYSGFVRKDKEEPNAHPTATTIDFTISGAFYNAHYDYDATTNSYKRSEGGAPHMQIDSAGAKTQISPKVVIALIMNQGIQSDGIHSTYNTEGSGKAYIFQDGVALPATWRKYGRTGQYTFTDASGATVKLNPGQTWLTAIGSADRATFK